ncbi:MAG TPA: hypothetical protein VE914_12090 [Candidatus Angelobacter sp.]|nr:hypothetical protein [Candidatus Angelobacter sp.]
MMTLASLAIRAGPDEYWKVVCGAPDAAGPILIGRGDPRPDG